MRYSILGVLLICFIQKASSQLIEIKDFGNNPGELSLFFHEAKDTILSPKPLVVVLHGCGQNANNVAELTGWNKLADLYHFNTLYPQQRIKNNAGQCFNWFKEKDINKGLGECASIHEMIQYITKNYPTDTNKIYITGLSAGGAMAVVMLATYPNQFNAGAIFAGGAYKSSKNGATAIASMMGINAQKRQLLTYHVLSQNISYQGKYPKLIIYQGLKDPVVHPHNADLLINQWTGVYQISPYPTDVDSSFQKHPGIIRSIHTANNGDTLLIAYKIEGMGHQLPIQPGNSYKEGGKSGVFAWERLFHSTYQTALDFGLIAH